MKQHKTALLSVFDKTGIAHFANQLSKQNFQILATEGTGAILDKNGIAYQSAEKASGNPEKLEGCIKTISYNIEAGIIFDRKNKVHQNEIKELAITGIDLVVCNFPPLQETVINPDDFNIQNVDVGGPLMVRAAAVNHPEVIVIVDQDDYELVGNKIANQEVTPQLRRKLAIKAFKYIQAYDSTLIKYLRTLN
jgi:phosphoribosylaminoimidazolecarboxamide formyltransferase / IMP cyclohydrolase